MAYINVIQRDQATGDLAEIYEDLVGRRGKLAEVHTIQSLNPESIRRHMDLYMTIMFGSSPLSRAEREMIGVIVSTTNRCRYCVAHHRAALAHFWKDKERLDLLETDPERAATSDRERALQRYAEDLTLRPDGGMEPTQGVPRDARRNARVAALHDAGLSDREILDASLVVGYFNFVNRLVLGLGVELEAEPGGYKYED